MNALLIGGLFIGVPGLEILSPGPDAPPWCQLDPGDYRARKTSWVRQIIIHTTKGIEPQHIIPGAGPSGREQVVAEFWRGDPQHSAAQVVIGSDGKVACLCDLAKVAAYHATTCNDYSVGIEVYQERDGGIYEAAIAALGLLVPALCEAFQIPFQIPTAYDNRPLTRLVGGGPDCVGVFGHRDNTTRRGRGDPGDAVFAELELRGAERLDFEARDDLTRWKRRQQRLTTFGAKAIVIDGIAGPSTVHAMRRFGFASGRAIDVAVERPPS